MGTPSAEILDQYKALREFRGIASLGNRTQIEFTGLDRATFAHNLCTNEIKKLTVGRGGCEAFITNVQGKTIGHGYVFSRLDSIVFDTVPGQGELLFKHFDRYHIREKVEIHDRSSERGELLVNLGGGNWPNAMSSEIDNNDMLMFGVSVSFRRVNLMGPNSHFISVSIADIPHVVRSYCETGVVECSPEAVEMARIEAGTPLFGRDITDKNLPQEVGRDRQAISFTKGCYLGQETVARIDALGHVNQSLVGVRFAADEVPAAGVELLSEEKVVGHVTSAAWSPHLSAPLALAYLRREFTKPETALQSSCGAARVVTLPIV